MTSGLVGSKAVNFLKEVVKHRKSVRSFEGLLFQQIEVVDGGEGRCVCELPVTEDHQNPLGSLHGGMTATLVDAVSTWALLTTPQQQPGVSVDLSVSYMKAVKVGDIIVIDAQTLKCGRTLAFLTVDIKSKTNGQLVAQGKHTKFIGS